MEPAGLAVGVLGLAGLFSASLDAIERYESWRNFTDESHLVRTLLEGQKLRLRLWGRAVGFDDGDKSANHHEALDDPQICSMIRTHLSHIEKLCTSANGTFLAVTGTGAGHTRGAPSLQSHAQPHPSARPESKRQKLKWALRNKAKCTEQAQMLASLVQALHDLVPLDGAKGARRAPRNDGNDALGRVGGMSTGRDPWTLEFDRILAKMEGPHIPNGLYEDAVQKRVDGTCDWILTRRLFLDWTSSDFLAGKAKILWVNGAPGFGKTILCARVVEHLCSTLDPLPAYFFFSSDFESRRDPFVALRSWLTQVLSHTVVFNLVREEWESQNGQIASRADVVEVFRKIVRAVSSFTFVMDGLDECAGAGQAWDADDSSVSTFLETIQHAVADTSTRIMIVSRSVPEIRQSIVRNGGVTWLDYSLTCDDVRTDTELYARSIVDKKLHNKDKTIRTDISMRLADRCKGQFLWVKLQEPSLRSGRNKKQLEAAIDTSPAALDHLYDRDWQRLIRLPTAESSRAVSLLRWVAFALHPLTVAEITEALLIYDDCDELPADEMPDCIDQEYVEGEILGLCGSLVETRNVASESSVGLWTVHLAHFSVKEFFVGRMAAGENALVANERLRSSQEATQNSILAMMCLRYVNLRGVWPAPHEESSQVKRSFLKYAAGSWYKHAAVSKKSDSAVIRLTNDFFSESNEKWRSWRKWYDMSDDEAREGEAASEYTAATPLYYASRLCLKETVSFLIREQRYSINERASLGMTALAASCNAGDAGTVAILLDAGADLRIANNKGWTPLNFAADKGCVEVVKLLLTNGADVEAVDNDGWTPCHAAADKGHVEVVRLLLANGADVTVMNGYGWTPLITATNKGHVEVIKVLLANGADATIANSYGWTPLYAAADKGHVDVVRLLLANGANVTVANGYGWTPLITATDKGHVEVVKVLLANGADVTVSNSYGWTPLYAASIKGHTEVVKVLLANGADITVADGYGWTPLYAASIKGHTEVVKVLLANGADVTVADGYGWTPLITAADTGHIEVVKVLLANGADVNIANSHGWTPCHAAADKGYVDVVKVLLTNGTDITLADSYGWTPLYVASSKGHIEVIKVLLTNGADVNVVAYNGWTLLNSAAINGHVDVVELLLENGADVVATDHRGSTPLHIASHSGHIDIVKLLLEKGSPTDVMDDEWRSPFFYACARGHMEVVEHLSSRSVTATTTDRYGATPLFGATRNGHEKVVAYLLAMGCDYGGFVDGLGQTLLWWASKSGNTQVIEAVLQLAKSKDIQVCDKDLSVEPRSSSLPSGYEERVLGGDSDDDDMDDMDDMFVHPGFNICGS
ncbi:hypothetical protein MY11210_001803 [Beauveria gryllotalpidicola]